MAVQLPVSQKKTNERTGCRKTHRLKMDGDISFAAESDRVLLWASQAQLYIHQRHHVGLDVIDGCEPAPGLIAAQFRDVPKPAGVEPDDRLDGIASDDGETINADGQRCHNDSKHNSNANNINNNNNNNNNKQTPTTTTTTTTS